MKEYMKIIYVQALLMTMIMSVVLTASAQRVSHRDPLSQLKRAITEANAPALTTEQETQLTTLITNYISAQPTEPDEALETAQNAYDEAILDGNIALAQAQAVIIASRQAELINAKLQSSAQFKISALAILKSGGQFDPLVVKYGADRVLNMVSVLVGRSFGGGPHGFGRG